VSPAPSAGPRLTPTARARRVAAGLSYAWRATRLARRLRPALVHANDWNTMWTALAIKRLCGARVVYDSHELWPDRNGRWEWRPWLLASEALFMRAADEVISASPGYADVLARRYRTRRPTVIRNIPEIAATEPARPTDSPLVVYVGGLMPGRGLEPLIDTLAMMPTARLRAVGPASTGYAERLLAQARALGVQDRLELRPPVPPAAVADELRAATAGLCLIEPVCRSYELTLPNKLFEYAAAGLPVLASDLPVIAETVCAAGIGEVVAPDDPHAIAAGLTRLSEPETWERAAAAARVFATTTTWSSEAERLSGVYRRVLATKVAA
jgi:glycosyltransferase involved in cell wall biosynthesis